MTARDAPNPALVDDATAFSLRPPRPAQSWGYGFQVREAVRSRPAWESAGVLLVLGFFVFALPMIFGGL